MSSKKTEKHVVKRKREAVDPTPMEIPVAMQKSRSMDDRMAAIINHSRLMQLHEQGYETFEEADDFDIPDDPVDMSTPWETDFDVAMSQSVDGGVTQKPQIDPEKAHEVKKRFKNLPKKKRKAQTDLEDAINAVIADKKPAE